MSFLNSIIDKLQATFPPNRIVALLAAPIAVGVSAGAAWVASNIGVGLDPAEITTIATAALLGVVTAAYKWLDGWQKHEARTTTDVNA